MCLSLCFQFFWVYTQSWIAGLYGNFNFLRNLHTVFHSSGNHFTFPPAVYRRSNFSTSFQYLSFSVLILAILLGVRRHLTVVLICISLMTVDVEHLFMCLLDIHTAFWSHVYSSPLLIVFFKTEVSFLFIYLFNVFLAASGLSCGTQDLRWGTCIFCWGRAVFSLVVV